MKYTIYYGAGTAELFTPEMDWHQRFMTLASKCFGIRKSILCCELLERSNEEPAGKIPEERERLAFGGDVYVWREDGARRMLEPVEFADDDWEMPE